MPTSTIRKSTVVPKNGPGASGFVVDAVTQRIKFSNSQNDIKFIRTEAVVPKTAAFTVRVEEGDTFQFNSTTAFTATLPAVSAANKGQKVAFVVKLAAGASSHKIDPADADKIYGDATSLADGVTFDFTGNVVGDYIQLQSDGVDGWFIVDHVFAGDTITGVTAGVATASKAVILDTNKAVDVVRTASLRIGVSGSETEVTATPAELNALAGTGLSSTELGLLNGALAGTNVASKTLAANAAKSIDVLQATTSLSVGGTGVPGAANVQTTITKAVTTFSDTVAKDVFTVTVPNGIHSAVVNFDFVGVLGAGGSIGAGESVRNSQYQLAITRTAGAATVPVLSAAVGGAAATGAGGQAITSVVATVSAITGAVGAAQTFTVLVAITRAGSGADNHTLHATARVFNANATGVTIA